MAALATHRLPIRVLLHRPLLHSVYAPMRTGTLAAGLRTFLRNSDGTFTPIEILGKKQVFPIALNDAGQMVGAYFPSGGLAEYFLRDADGGVTIIDFPGEFETQLFALDAHGTVLGSYRKTDNTSPRFLLAPGRHLHQLRSARLHQHRPDRDQRDRPHHRIPQRHGPHRTRFRAPKSLTQTKERCGEKTGREETTHPKNGETGNRR